MSFMLYYLEIYAQTHPHIGRDWIRHKCRIWSIDVIRNTNAFECRYGID